mmetsp:Transcript_11978/g.17858  ORF Transcript_11978/g.17858 Transcript_11978/m.17858 type:complete len:599 (+) Transcript_11978:82-1878(+)
MSKMSASVASENDGTASKPLIPSSLPTNITFHAAGSCICCSQLLDLVSGPVRAILFFIVSIIRIPFVVLSMILPIPVKTCLTRGIIKCGYPLYLTWFGKRYWSMHLANIYVGGGSPRPHTVDIKPTRLTTCTIWPVPVAADNYAYIIVDNETGLCAIVDPGASVPISLAIFQLGLYPRYILLTHAHHDHAGGIEDLKSQFPNIKIYYGEGEKLFGYKGVVLKDFDVFKLGSTRILTVTTPCHTPGSLVFAVSHVRGKAPHFPPTGPTPPIFQQPSSAEALLTGDTLFLGSCGAPFHGTNALMWNSISKLKPFPNNCLIFPGHEYTESNRWFAYWLEPRNTLALALAHEAQAQRSLRQPTIPGVLGVEKKVNPWMRVDEDALRTAIELRLEQYNKVYCCYRQWDCCNRAPPEWSRADLSVVPSEKKRITEIINRATQNSRSRGSLNGKIEEKRSGKTVELSHVVPKFKKPRDENYLEYSCGKSTPLKGDGVLRPLEHPSSSTYSNISLDMKDGPNRDMDDDKTVNDIYNNIRKLQTLFEVLVPARVFHLRSRRDGGLSQSRTSSMVWADGHVYLTGASIPLSIGGKVRRRTRREKEGKL